jgi:hypothetical protein
MQAAIPIRVPQGRDGLIVANVGGYSYQNTIFIVSGPLGAEKPSLSEAEGKDLPLSSSLRRIC